MYIKGFSPRVFKFNVKCILANVHGGAVFCFGYVSLIC